MEGKAMGKKDEITGAIWWRVSTDDQREISPET